MREEEGEGCFGFMGLRGSESRQLVVGFGVGQPFILRLKQQRLGWWHAWLRLSPEPASKGREVGRESKSWVSAPRVVCHHAKRTLSLAGEPVWLRDPSRHEAARSTDGWRAGCSFGRKRSMRFSLLPTHFVLLEEWLMELARLDGFASLSHSGASGDNMTKT